MKYDLRTNENYRGEVLGYVRRNGVNLELIDLKFRPGTADELVSLALIHPIPGSEIKAQQLTRKGADDLDILRTKWRRLLRETEARK